MARSAQLTAVSVLGLLLTGCLSVQREHSNPYLAAGLAAHPYERLVRDVELDVTTRERVLAVLGKPHAVTEADNGSELLRYDWPVSNRTRVVVLSLLAVDLSGDDMDSVYVEIDDDRVRRYWVTD
jgi:hypothetical protein